MYRQKEWQWVVYLPPVLRISSWIILSNASYLTQVLILFFQHIEKFYWYIDDIFCIYTDSQSIENFFNWLNTLHPSIQFTMSGSKKCVNYLDTKVFRTQQNTLAVDPFKKETDRNTYLHYSSFHSRALRNNIPYGQFLRIRWNCTNYSDFSQSSKDMQRDFLARGYPKEIVQDASRQAKEWDRKDLLTTSTRESPQFKGITVALDLTPLAEHIKRIVLKHWHLLSNIPGCVKLPRFGLRKTKSIKDLVMRSDVRKIQICKPIITGHYKSGNCGCCAQAWEIKMIVLPSINFEKQLDFYSSCNTKMCVYLLECECGLCYIGYTQCKLKVRVMEHRSRIRNKVTEAPMV